MGKPRTVGRQKQRDNAPAETTEMHYKRNLIIPVLDHLLVEMESRFFSGQDTAVLGYSGRYFDGFMYINRFIIQQTGGSYLIVDFCFSLFFA